jgi:hypothetical protein
LESACKLEVKDEVPEKYSGLQHVVLVGQKELVETCNVKVVRTQCTIGALKKSGSVPENVHDGGSNGRK